MIKSDARKKLPVVQSIWTAGHSPVLVSELSALLRTGRKRHGQLHRLTIDLLQYFPEVILCRVQPCRHGHVEVEHNQVHGGKEEESEEKKHASSPHAFVLNGRKKKKWYIVEANLLQSWKRK